MKSKNEPKFDRIELVLWLFFALLFLDMVGCVWIVAAHRLSGNSDPLG